MGHLWKQRATGLSSAFHNGFHSCLLLVKLTVRGGSLHVGLLPATWDNKSAFLSLHWTTVPKIITTATRERPESFQSFTWQGALQEMKGLPLPLQCPAHTQPRQGKQPPLSAKAPIPRKQLPRVLSGRITRNQGTRADQTPSSDWTSIICTSERVWLNGASQKSGRRQRRGGQDTSQAVGTWSKGFSEYPSLCTSLERIGSYQPAKMGMIIELSKWTEPSNSVLIYYLDTGWVTSQEPQSPHHFLKHRCFPSSVLFCCQSPPLPHTASNCTLLGAASLASNKVHFTSHASKHCNRSADTCRRVVFARARAGRKKRFMATRHMQLGTGQPLKISFEKQLFGSSRSNLI